MQGDFETIKVANQQLKQKGEILEGIDLAEFIPKELQGLGDSEL